MGRFRLIFLALLALVPSVMSARIAPWPETIELPDMLSTAPVILRGEVRHVSVSRHGDPLPVVVQFRVERWYRGGRGSKATLHYRGRDFVSISHDCIDLDPAGSHWLIFATENNGHLELVDDCEGAVPVSRLIGPALKHADRNAQLEADLTAGLADPDPIGRRVSIQRLGGLKSRSSLPALHEIIEHGNSSENVWARLAVLEIGEGADDPSAWKQVREALKEVRVADNLQTIRAGLVARDRTSRMGALESMNALTHNPACAFSESMQWDNAAVVRQARRCAAWWDANAATQLPLLLQEDGR
jgi:hypothetical protein